MADSRDRQEDVLGSNRLRSFASGCRGRAISPVPFLLEDDDDVVDAPPTPGPMGEAAGRGRIGTPLCRGRAISPVPFLVEDDDDDVVEAPLTPGPMGVAAAAGRGRIGSPRGGRGRRSSKLSVLPSWYPRKPLQAMTTGLRRCPPSSNFDLGNIRKILLSATKNQTHSPQKKLLENIELVEKLVMEELLRLKTRPSATKAEREKRMRTLMSMR